MKENLMTILQKEVDHGSIQAAGIFLSRQGETLLEETFGPYEIHEAVDIGSLKEIVATLPAILKLVERRRKKLALNHPVAQYIESFSGDEKETIQIMNLLTHTSGLPAASLSSLEDVKLDFKPGSKVSYSPMNFQFLPFIFEQASGQDFEMLIRHFIYDPLLMERTDIVWEDNGDFKLTSTLKDLSHFAEMIRNNGTYDYIKIIKPKAVQLSKQPFTSFLNQNRGLGWEFQEDYYGFTSQTGSSMWFNPNKKAYFILLLEAEDDEARTRIQEETLDLFKTYS